MKFLYSDSDRRNPLDNTKSVTAKKDRVICQLLLP